MAHKVSVEVSLGRSQKYVIYYVKGYDPIVKWRGLFCVVENVFFQEPNGEHIFT